MEEIRLGKASDADDVARLWMDLMRSQSALDSRYVPAEDAAVRWRNDFGEWLDRASRRLFVAVVDGRPAGFVTAERFSPAPIFRERSEVYIGELFVAPDVRRRGLATALVGAVREWAESLGAERIRAGVLAANKEGLDFWRIIGGEPIATTVGIELPASNRSVQRERQKIGF